MFRRHGIGPADDQPGPGEPRRGQQRCRGSGKGPAPSAAGRRARSTTTPPERQATSLPRTPRRSAADQAGAGAQADQPGRAHPPRARWAARQPARDSRRSPPGCTAPWPARGAAAASAGDQCRDHLPGRGTAGWSAASAAPSRTGPARTGEPLDHRRVQQHLRDRLQPQRDSVGRQPGRRPQQVRSPAPGVGGSASSTTDRAKRATGGDTDDGCQHAMYPATSAAIQFLYCM